MPFINLPANLQAMFQSMTDRILKLEMAQRFTNPNVDLTANPPANPRRGDQFYDISADGLKYWNGTSYVEIADNNKLTSISHVYPTLQTANNNMVYTGNPVTIHVQRIGYMVTTQAEIICTNITNFGTGQYQITMPLSFPAAVYSGTATGMIVQGGIYYTIFASIDAGSRTFKLWSPTSNGGSDAMTYNKPAILTTSAKIFITGVALLA